MKKIVYLAMIATLLLSVVAVAVPSDLELQQSALSLRHIDLDVRTHLINASAGQFTNFCTIDEILGYPIPWFCFDIKVCSLWGTVNCFPIGPSNRIGKAEANYFLQPSIWEATAYGQKKGLLFWKCQSDPIALVSAFEPGFYVGGELVGGCGAQLALAYITPTPIGPGPALPLGEPGSGLLYLDSKNCAKLCTTEFQEISTDGQLIIFRGYGWFTFLPTKWAKKTITCLKPFDITVTPGDGGPFVSLNVYDKIPGCIIYHAEGLVFRGGLLIL